MRAISFSAIGLAICGALATITLQGREGVRPSNESVDFEPKDFCAEFSGKYVAIYSEVYLVDSKCNRIPIEPRKVFRLTQAGIVITSVAATAVADSPVMEDSPKLAADKVCSELVGHYVTLSSTNIFKVEETEGGCQRRAVDWETFKVETGGNSKVIERLEVEAFYAISEGPPLPSVLDQTRILGESTVPEIIPASEACSMDILDRFVAYYGQPYFIEAQKGDGDGRPACTKRLVDGSVLTRKFPKMRLREITSEQHLSIPDGPEYSW